MQTCSQPCTGLFHDCSSRCRFSFLCHFDGRLVKPAEHYTMLFFFKFLLFFELLYSLQFNLEYEPNELFPNLLATGFVIKQLHPLFISSTFLYCTLSCLRSVKQRKKEEHENYKLHVFTLSLSLQLSSSQASMEETTTVAALLSPAEQIHQSRVSVVGRLVVERWCVWKTCTSMFTASPAKVKHLDLLYICCFSLTDWKVSYLLTFSVGLVHGFPFVKSHPNSVCMIKY